MTDMTPEHALQKLLATAEGNPFCPVGHLVEHGLGGADALRAALSRPADTEASRTLDALIAIASGDDGLPDDLRASVERLQVRVGRKAVPEGYKLVPVEPTDAMISAGADVLDGFRVDALYTYDAMLAAAPEPAGAEESLGDASEPVYRLTIRDDRSDVIDACPALLDLDPGHYELHARPESAEGDSE